MVAHRKLGWLFTQKTAKQMKNAWAFAIQIDIKIFHFDMNQKVWMAKDEGDFFGIVKS